MNSFHCDKIRFSDPNPSPELCTEPHPCQFPVVHTASTLRPSELGRVGLLPSFCLFWFSWFILVLFVYYLASLRLLRFFFLLPRFLSLPLPFPSCPPPFPTGAFHSPPGSDAAPRSPAPLRSGAVQRRGAARGRSAHGGARSGAERCRCVVFVPLPRGDGQTDGQTLREGTEPRVVGLSPALGAGLRAEPRGEWAGCRTPCYCWEEAPRAGGCPVNRCQVRLQRGRVTFTGLGGSGGGLGNGREVRGRRQRFP